MRSIPTTFLAVVALVVAATPVVAQDDAITVVPNEQFCNLVTDDIAACEQALGTLASAAMVPEAFAGLIVAAPADTVSDVADDTPDEAGNAKLGASQSRDDVTITVSKVDWNPKSSNSFFEPDKGNKYVSVLVRYEALEDDVSYNPFYWSASDKDGFSYSFSAFNPKEPGLTSGELRQGKKTQGWVTFEVPKSVNWLEIQESPFLGDDLYWTVKK